MRTGPVIILFVLAVCVALAACGCESQPKADQKRSAEAGEIFGRIESVPDRVIRHAEAIIEETRK